MSKWSVSCECVRCRQQETDDVLADRYLLRLAHEVTSLQTKLASAIERLKVDLKDEQEGAIALETRLNNLRAAAEIAEAQLRRHASMAADEFRAAIDASKTA